MKILFDKFGIEIFEIDFVIEQLLIFYLLTPAQGHQFDPRVKILLVFCSSHHLLKFDMPLTIRGKN